MTNDPAREFIPNSYQTPNVLVDKLMPLLTASEWMLVNFAVRCILGYKDKIADRQARISVSRFQETGLSRPAIISGLKALKEYRVLQPIGEPTIKGQQWKINFEGDVDFDGLNARQAAKKNSGKKRTTKARSVSLTSGKSDLPVPVNLTDQESVSGTDTYKHNNTNTISNSIDSMSAKLADMAERISKLEQLLKQRESQIAVLQEQLEEKKKAAKKEKPPRAEQPLDAMSNAIALGAYSKSKGTFHTMDIARAVWGEFHPDEKPTIETARPMADELGRMYIWYPQAHKELSPPGRPETVIKYLKEFRVKCNGHIPHKMTPEEDSDNARYALFLAQKAANNGAATNTIHQSGGEDRVSAITGTGGTASGPAQQPGLPAMPKHGSGELERTG